MFNAAAVVVVVVSLEGDSQLLRLEEELQRVREELQQERNHSNVSTTNQT